MHITVELPRRPVRANLKRVVGISLHELDKTKTFYPCITYRTVRAGNSELRVGAPTGTYLAANYV